MTKHILSVSAIALAGALFASAATAKPLTLTAAQMDTVAGGAFVCPVLSTDAVASAPNAVEVITVSGEEYYTIAGPHVGSGVDGNGTSSDTNTGTPVDGFSSPGDTSYTAIWANL